MLLLLTVHMVAALAAPLLVRWLGRRAFLVLALAPGSAAAWALSQSIPVTVGRGPASSVSWIPGLGIDLSFRLDSLSWLMVLLVGGIGALVLVYCSVYFAPRSSGLGRFCGVLTGFAGAMLGLVTSSNLLQIFIFWELTTVFSYLLIGHYATRKASRRAAMKAILVTTAGGLALLVGIVLIGHMSGTYDISEILANPPMGTTATAAVFLLLVGAVSKSALVPLHFWLPAAMAAPTPVSAYLHAAAMVKAGVYLVARFAPAFAGHDAWRMTVIFLGCVTLVVGGYRALRQHDLKLILAFGTISQLGLLVLLVGSGSRAVALAGMAMLGAHAMFKAALFLIVGVVDASTGTRDLRQLSGVGRAMPVTARVAGLATASMIGLPPFAGFVAKEAAISALLSADYGAPWLSAIVVIAVALGSVLTVAYGLRLWWGAFGTKRETSGLVREPTRVNLAPLLLVAPAFLLSVAGLAAALLPRLGEQVLSPHAATYPGGAHGHLTLWDGLTPAFAISAAILVAGLGLYWVRARVERWQEALQSPLDADLVYRRILQRVDSLAADVTALFQRGSLPFYLGVILLVLVALPGGAMLLQVPWPDQVQLAVGPSQALVGILIIVATILAARSRRRLKAVVLAGITGYGTAMLFMLYGAPDLALTQALVETIILIVFVLVLRRLPAYFSNRPLAAGRWVRLGLGVTVGVTIAGFALTVPHARIHEPVSRLFAEEAVAFGGGRNIVNVTLVDIRAWDTMGEIAVLLAAATGMASLIFLRGRSGEITRAGDLDRDDLQILGSGDPDPMA
ncbi:MAG: Na+/H+ antiporter subunit A, partial [Acidimicrobiia bacterium]